MKSMAARLLERLNESSSVLPSRNRRIRHGFYGSFVEENKYDRISDSPDKAWKLAMTKICRATGKSQEDVRKFLDGDGGIPFAATVIDIMNETGQNLSSAISSAIDDWMNREGWGRLDKRIQEIVDYKYYPKDEED